MLNLPHRDSLGRVKAELPLGLDDINTKGLQLLGKVDLWRGINARVLIKN